MPGCGSGGGSSDDNFQQAQSGEDAESESDAPGGVLERQDEEGLVFVYIENGAAEVRLDIDRWEALFDITGSLEPEQSYISDFLNDGPFPVAGVSDRIKDACVGYVQALDIYDYTVYSTPAVVLLMENGTVEYFMADPFISDGPGEYYSYGKMPWLEDIVKLTYEAETDGYGNMTIYAWDSEGFKYNISLVGHLVNIFHEGGIWEFFLTDEWGDGLQCGMNLSEDGNVWVTVSRNFAGDADYLLEQTYEGRYEVFLAESGDRVSGTIDFDLGLTWWIAEIGDSPDPADISYWDERQRLVGTYSFQAYGDGYLNLYLMYGDALMHYGWRGDSILSYSFWHTLFFF